ncbi:MAG: hypothetical protein ACI977_000514 [Candidatus Nanohaloarchaea archaeon]|jgi:hypothetical protein
MSEELYSFEEGPYELLEYEIKGDEGKAVITVNQGDLGRLVIEDIDTVEELRNALDEVEQFLEEHKRRQEEL